MEKVLGEITSGGIPVEFVTLLVKFRSIANENKRVTGQEPMFTLSGIEAVIKETASNLQNIT